MILSSAASLAQLTTPLYVSPSQSIQDEFGRTLQGTAQSPGDTVILYEAVNGVIHPPGIDGTPHPDNVPISGGESGIGFLAPIGDPEPGLFNFAISGAARPSNNDTLFVRVFNAATPSQASFYGDSQLFTVSRNKPFTAVIEQTDQPMDPADDDSDGLNNSYEKSLGTSSAAVDTDGDGMSDFAEISAGTDGTDDDSFLALSGLSADAGDVLLSWMSISGKTYQAEATGNLVSDEFTAIGDDVIAGGTSTTIRIDGELLKPGAHYRIRVMD